MCKKPFFIKICNQTELKCMHKYIAWYIEKGNVTWNSVTTKFHNIYLDLKKRLMVYIFTKVYGLELLEGLKVTDAH
jgi:hypothetical protein